MFFFLIQSKQKATLEFEKSNSFNVYETKQKICVDVFVI